MILWRLFFWHLFWLALSPGPDNIFVLTQSALYGKLAGYQRYHGPVHGVDRAHPGRDVWCGRDFFRQSAMAFAALKICGAGYLLYLAWQAFRASAAPIDAVHNGARDFLKLYRRGIVMNITNPKVSVFFLAFLPQFADPARGHLALQLIGFGGIFIGATILVFGAVAFLAGFIREWFYRSNKTQIILNRIAATVFCGPCRESGVYETVTDSASVLIASSSRSVRA